MSDAENKYPRRYKHAEYPEHKGRRWFSKCVKDDHTQIRLQKAYSDSGCH